MKKYFMKGYDEPVEFGDVIHFTVTEESDKHEEVEKEVECTLTPEVLQLLLAMGVIEAVDSKISFKEEQEGDDEECDDEEVDATLDDFINTTSNFMDLTADTLRAQQQVIDKQQKDIDNLNAEVQRLKRQKPVCSCQQPMGSHIKVVRFKDLDTSNLDDFFKPLHNWVYDD